MHNVLDDEEIEILMKISRLFDDDDFKGKWKLVQKKDWLEIIMIMMTTPM